MDGFFWKTWLVVGALTIGGTSSLPQKPLPYDKAVELGVAIYNSKAAEEFLYRLVEAPPQPEWDPNSESTQMLNFTMKETVCPVESEHSLEECDFRGDGVVRQCKGYYFFGETPPIIVVICIPVAGLEEKEEEGKEPEEKEEEKGQPGRVKRFKNFFKKGVKKAPRAVGGHFHW